MVLPEGKARGLEASPVLLDWVICCRIAGLESAALELGERAVVGVVGAVVLPEEKAPGLEASPVLLNWFISSRIAALESAALELRERAVVGVVGAVALTEAVAYTHLTLPTILRVTLWWRTGS